ncbi:HIT family protein [Streptomyces sp. TR06-5]|uniref:HIT family protein n=1 Tax=unclassified Streptomyces TaxID=2593676 RepID=UPI0039A238A9
MGDSRSYEPVTGRSDCAFCRVVSGAAPAHRVFEDGTAVAFLDTRPLFHGHVLVVPVRHAETLTDLTEDEVGPLFARVRRTVGAVERAMGAAGTFVGANNRVSQSVPHFHVHVVPRNRKDGLRGFFWPRTRYADQAEADDVASRIRAALPD